MTPRGLPLFAPVRRKVVINRAPPISERQLHLSVAGLLRKFADPDRWIWTHLPFGGKRPATTGALLKAMGTRPGWPDFIFIGPLGAIHFLELKIRNGELSEHQESFFAAMRVRNIECRVARSFNEAARILGQWGVIPAKIAEQIAA